MKYFIFLVFSSVVCQVLSYRSDPYNLVREGLRTPTIRGITDMLRRNCKNKDAELKEKMENMESCYLGIRVNETICGVTKERLIKCVKPMADLMETCLKSTKYADIPQFTLEVVNSVANYVCRTKGEKLIELIHPCLMTIGYEKEQVCLKNFKQKLNNIERDDTITNVKTDICKSLEKTKSCFLKEFKNSCKNDVTMDSAVGFYDAVITKPCKHV